MSQKIYRSIKGKPVDIGAMRLQNENVRAVGNMGVNARGDRIDAQGNVIDPIGKQVNRRIQRQTNVSDTPVHSSQRAAADAVVPIMPDQLDDDTFLPLDPTIVDEMEEIATPVVATPEAPVVSAPAPVSPEVEPTTGGLAAAIARAKAVKEELNNPATGVKKI